MYEETTRRLEELLLRKDLNSEADLELFIKQHTARKEPVFCEYFNAFIAAHELDVTELIRRCGINRNYIYGILNGNRPHPGRDKVIALCIAAEMNYTETNRALKIAGHRALYPKIERDARLAICINRGLGNVMEVNLLLDEYGLEPLDI